MKVRDCPFCGGRAHPVMDMTTGAVSLIACELCGVEVYSGHRSIEEVKTLWERRTEDGN